MTRRASRFARGRGQAWSLAALSLGLASCSFLLDFDSLGKQKGASGGNAGLSSGGATSGGASAQGGSSASAGLGAGEAGAAGALCSPACAPSTDPCMLSRCVDQGNGPECVQEQRQGLVLDHEFDPIIADRHYELGLVAGSDEFYLSDFSTTAAQADANIYRFSATSTTITPAVDVGLLKVAGAPASLAALAVDASAGLKIHAYIGLKPALATSTSSARAWHLVFDSNFALTQHTAVSSTFAESSRPSVLNVTNTIWGAWINADGTIGLDSPGLSAPVQFGSSANPATNVALLATRANRPAALYTGTSQGVFLESEAGPVTVSECQTAPGAYFGVLSAPTTSAGLWLTAWSKSGQGFLTTESNIALCTLTGCAADSTCDANEASNGERDIAIAAEHLQGDATGVMYYVDVLPTLSAATDGSANVNAAVSAVLFRIDYGTSPTPMNVQPPTAIGAPLLLSAQTTTEAAGYRGPDLAAAAMIADVAAIAWVEPTPEGTDAIRVQRYKMCLP